MIFVVMWTAVSCKYHKNLEEHESKRITEVNNSVEKFLGILSR